MGAREAASASSKPASRLMGLRPSTATSVPRFPPCVLKAGRGGKESCHEPVIETRGHQMFPELDAGQIETAKRFASGPAREFAPGEIVYDVGERQAPAWLVLKGSIDAIGRDGLGREASITTPSRRTDSPAS